MGNRWGYRYALSLTSQFYFCGIPFRLDTAPKCSLNCLYCFAMSRGGRRTSTKLLLDFKKFEKKITALLENKAIPTSATTELLARRVPIHFGGISDPFSNIVTSQLSKQLLHLLGTHNYPIIISTKNAGELIKDDNLKTLKNFKHLAVQISITTPDKKLSCKIEPKVPPPEERIDHIRTLSKEGIYCMCRLQPLLVSEIDNVSNVLIPMLSEAKCRHVVVEYLKLPVERKASSFNAMLKAVRWDAYGFYEHRGAILAGREWILPNKFKWEHLQPIISSIHKSGMTYGAGDYGLNHLGDTECCCGVDKLEGFSNWFHGNFGNVIRNAASQCIGFSSVERHWLPQKSIKMVLNSNCRLSGDNHSVFDYLRNKWNSPGKPNAPDCFLGVSWSGGYDNEGNCTYVKDKTFF